MLFFVTVKILFEMFQNDIQTFLPICDIRQGKGYFMKNRSISRHEKHFKSVKILLKNDT